MKKILIVLLTFILVFTTLLPSYTAFSKETENYCENMSFSVQTIRAGDEVIEGKAEPESEIKLVIEEIEETVISDDNGRFEFEADELEVGNKIQLMHEQHEIDTEVEEANSERETIESELDTECEVPKEVLAEEDEKGLTEMNDDESDSNELSDESSEEAADDLAVEESPEENETVKAPDELPDEEMTDMETLEEETVNSDEAAAEVSTEEERVEEAADNLVLEESSAENETMKENEELIDEELTDIERLEEEAEDDTALEDNGSPEEIDEETDQESKEESGDVQDIFPKAEVFAAREMKQQTQVPVLPAEGSNVTVTTRAEFDSAVSNERVEVINLASNIISSGVINVRSNTGQKIINADGYDINMGGGQLLIASSITDMVVRDAGNLFTTNSNPDQGFFRKTNSSVKLHLENINFNVSNAESGGKLGSNWEGEIHFYGSNTVNTANSSNSMAFRKIIVHQKAVLNLNHYSSGSAIYFDRNFLDLGTSDYGMDILDNGSVNIYSNSAVMSSNSSSLFVGRTITFNIHEKSHTVFSGSGDSIFQNDSRMLFNIVSPHTVDLINRSNNRLFSRDNDINFNASEVSIHGWNGTNVWSEMPSHMTSVLTEAQFTFDYRTLLRDRTTVQNMSPSVPGFTSDFPPTINRMMFDHSEEHTLDLEVQSIYDTDHEINGITAEYAEVTMYDENDNILDVSSSDINGEFTFNLEMPFKRETALKFKAVHLNHESDVVEQRVIGNKLAFHSVTDLITFSTTEIRDGVTDIERANDGLDVNVLSTKDKGSWILSAEVKNPLTNQDGNTLSDAMYFAQNGEYKTLEHGAVPVAAESTATDKDLYEISWPKDEGILMKVNPISAVPDTTYSTKIEWTLTDGP